MQFNLGVIKGGKNACGDIEIKELFALAKLLGTF
jgi:hypothetical protein